jgi:exonuclease SbcD
MQACIEGMRPHFTPGRPRVLVAHAFVAGERKESESERPLSVGGAGTVSADLFEDFDYVALGHLHAPQVVSSRCIYSGSPLKYSFSEAEDVKSVVIVDISDSGTVLPRLIPLTARRDVRNLEGALADLIAIAPTDLRRDDYLRITLTDDGALLNALGRLREAYPNVLQLERRFLQADSMTAIGEASARRRESTEADLFAGFFREVVGAEPNDEEAALFHEALAHLQRVETEVTEATA